MPAFDKNHSVIIVERFKALSTATTKWTLFYLITLFITWFVSIYSNEKDVKNYVTTINEGAYFKALYGKLKTERRQIFGDYKHKYYRDSLRLDSNNKFSKGIDTALNSRMDKLAINLGKARQSSKNFQAIKLFLDTLKKYKGEEKKAYRDSLRGLFFPKDFALAQLGVKKAEAEAKRERILNKDIPFNVPGINAINLKYTAGLVFWQILNFVLLLYLFLTRMKMIAYLQDIYRYKKNEIGNDLDEWRKLDLQLPIWMVPFKVKNDKDRSLFKALLGWSSVTLVNFLGLTLLLVIMILQIYVAWTLWHVFVMYDFTDLYPEVFSIVLMSLSTFLILLWLKPIVLSTSFGQEQAFAMKRREFIKLGISFSYFLFFIPSIAKSIPLMKGADLSYNRFRKRKKYAFQLKDGFYLNKHKGVLHYFSQGVSPSMRSMSKDEARNMIPKLKKIDILMYNDDSQATMYRLPHSSYVLEKEAYKLSLAGEYFTAFKMLIVASLYYQQKMGNSLLQTRERSVFMGEMAKQKRIVSFMAGLTIRAEHFLKGEDLQEIKSAVESRKDMLRPETLATYRQNKIFVKKWTNKKGIPQLMGKKNTKDMANLVF
ncbi:hypothetical protein [Pedobacter panaciterrae]